MNVASIQRARALQQSYASHLYIPQPYMFWTHFYTEDQNTRTLLKAFEAISRSNVPDEAKIREELLMMAVTLKHTARFRLRLMSIDLNKTELALQKATARIRELEAQIQPAPDPSWVAWLLDRVFANTSPPCEKLPSSS